MGNNTEERKYEEESMVLTLPLLAKESPQSAGRVRLLDFFSSWSPASSTTGSSLVCMQTHRLSRRRPTLTAQEKPGIIHRKCFHRVFTLTVGFLPVGSVTLKCA